MPLRGLGLANFLADVLDERHAVLLEVVGDRPLEDLGVEEGGMELRTYRGVHRLNKDEEGRVKCVACFMCSTACPARCIHIEAAESPWEDREKYPAKFDIDELRCIYCGMCEEACPVDAIELTHEYDIVGLTRQEMIFDKSKLLQIFDETVKDEPM